MNNDIGRIPPQAVDLEKAVLGAIMLESGAYTEISGIINSSSFYRTEHQKIFDVISFLVSKGRSVDLLTVTQELKNRNQLEEIGGPLYVTQLTSNVATTAHVEEHARIIAEMYYKRQAIIKAGEIIKHAYGDDDVETLGSMWNRFGDELEDIFTVSDCGTVIKTVLKETVKEIEKDCAASGENKTPGIPTGFPSLDENTGGWRGGDMIVLAARPGIGKTSFALLFALVAAKAGYWVNIFSLEMKKTDLAKIMLAKESGVYRSNIRDGYLKQEDWVRINQAIAQIENLPIIFRDAVGMNISQIQMVINKNHKNGKCDFAIIDYMQLVKAAGALKGTREQEISEISRTLKTTALANDIPILALSQLNRAAEGEVPQLSNLRESGAIEQDADIVCFLYKESRESEIIRLIMDKHRGGRTGDMDIHANSDMTRFVECGSTLSPQEVKTETDSIDIFPSPYIPANEDFEDEDLPF